MTRAEIKRIFSKSIESRRTVNRRLTYCDKNDGFIRSAISRLREICLDRYCYSSPSSSASLAHRPPLNSQWFAWRPFPSDPREWIIPIISTIESSRSSAQTRCRLIASQVANCGIIAPHLRSCRLATLSTSSDDATRGKKNEKRTIRLKSRPPLNFGDFIYLFIFFKRDNLKREDGLRKSRPIEKFRRRISARTEVGRISISQVGEFICGFLEWDSSPTGTMRFAESTHEDSSRSAYKVSSLLERQRT